MKVLILEDDAQRASAFTGALRGICPTAEVLVWCSARKMCQELEAHLPDAVLISLDHDLPAKDDCGDDPGSGMDVVAALSSLPACCPVVVHTSNTDASWSMVNELRHRGWRVERAGPVGMGAGWIHTVWSSVARRLMEESKGEPSAGGNAAAPRASA
jgi:hypothetical protein